MENFVKSDICDVFFTMMRQQGVYKSKCWRNSQLWGRGIELKLPTSQGAKKTTTDKEPANVAEKRKP